jgi:hypothetical protein
MESEEAGHHQGFAHLWRNAQRSRSLFITAWFLRLCSGGRAKRPISAAAAEVFDRAEIKNAKPAPVQ